MTILTDSNLFPDGWRIGGHQNFPVRSIWPKKAVDFVSEDPLFFTKSEQALVKLGVGKVMVGVIQHWGHCCGILEKDRQDNRNTDKVSSLGDFLLGKTGRDPYLEKIDTAWIMHYNICTSIRSWIWRWLFGYSDMSEFNLEEQDRQIVKIIQDHCADETAKAPALSRIRRDLDCWLTCYSFPQRSPKAQEDIADCPLRDLKLVQRIGSRRIVLMRRRERAFPTWVFAWAAIEFSKKLGQNPINLDTLIYGYESPGKVFCLSEETIVKKLWDIKETTGGEIDLIDSAGVKQVYIKNTDKTGLDYLAKGYKS